ncbi:hypothetical protein [Alkalilimnicola ehrlichii]|nr:hypothetical protein [Alkalilimnicola ehrlichii]
MYSNPVLRYIVYSVGGLLFLLHAIGIGIFLIAQENPGDAMPVLANFVVTVVAAIFAGLFVLNASGAIYTSRGFAAAGLLAILLVASIAASVFPFAGYIALFALAWPLAIWILEVPARTGAYVGLALTFANIIGGLIASMFALS